MNQSDTDTRLMSMALELAARGQGCVEPNPMVGCVIVADDDNHQIVGQGWHRNFGGPHAEVETLAAAGPRATGATMYVTLEPCCHHGKTPPCTQRLIEAGLSRVVVAMRDPFPQVDGGGIMELESAGIEVHVGIQEDEARELNAPYLKRLRMGRPWVIAKWAMTLDGKIASSVGDSRWISCEDSRAMAHKLRGRVDAVAVGLGTARKDDPLLTARPPGCRVATRMVLDTRASLPLQSKLVQTAADAPVLVAVGPVSCVPQNPAAALRDAGCEVFHCEAPDNTTRLGLLLDELGRRQMTNVLVEGGGKLLGGLFDAGLIDEVHAFIAPKLIGGKNAPSPLDGIGVEMISGALELAAPVVQRTGQDVYIHGRLTGWEVPHPV